MVRPHISLRVLIAAGSVALLVITAYVTSGAVSAPAEPELRLMRSSSGQVRTSSAAAAHQPEGSGRPSWKPAADCTPITARSWSSSSVRAPA